MATPRTPNQKKAYAALKGRLNQYSYMVQTVYDTLNAEAARLALSAGYDGEREFSWDDFPQTQKRIADLQARFVGDIGSVVYTGTSQEWAESNLLQDLLVSKALKSYKAQVHGKKYAVYYQTNSEALKAFQERADNGMNLSARLWKQSQGYRRELECAIGAAVEKGTSAITLSKRISKYLTNYDQLKADYKEKFGKAADCHDCEYNSIRLARTEINMAYRTAEQKRWQQLDFVLGYEIKLSGSHPVTDICDELKGRYPKDFVWTGWHPSCYSDDSEVLTGRGWLLFKDVQSDDRILSLNPDTRSVEWVGIQAVQSFERKSEMMHFFNKSLDCLVTPDHQMVYINKCDGRIKKCPASEYTQGKGGFYRSCEYDAPEVKEMVIEGEAYDFDLFCEFMGYWLSDGSVEKERSGVIIAQKDGQPYKELMIDCVRRMGFEPNVLEETIALYNSALRRYLSQFGKSHDKYIPQEIKNASKRQIQLFLDAFIKCDGSVRFRPECCFTGSHGSVFSPKVPERLYFTTSEQMAGDLSELILKVGHRPSFYLEPAGVAQKKDGTVIKSNYDCWRISECVSATSTVFNKEAVAYSGMVYDLTLERNHIMYIRRNGKCFWGSNCMCYSIPILKTEEEFWADDDTTGVNAVTDVPEKVHEWVGENAERLEKAAERGTLPYWLRDNPGLMEGVTAKRVEPALREIIEEKKDIHDMFDTSSPESKVRMVLRNERVREYKRVRESDEYENVAFDFKTLGLKANHVGHNFDKRGGVYEKHVRDAGYNAGHAVILENEFGTTIGERFTEGTWDGKKFEVAGCETGTSNNILHGLSHCASKGETSIAVLDFPKGGFNQEVWERTLGRYRGLKNVNNGQYLEFERIICVQQGKIIIDIPFP